MKFHPVLIFFCFTLVTMIKAQKYSKINKPMVNLNARPLVTTSPKLPEERRKLSIFPKNMAKFVVTSKPYSKVRSYSPWEITTKKPLMQKIYPKDVKHPNVIPVTRPSLTKFTYTPPVEASSKMVEDVDRVYLSNKKNEQQILIYPENNSVSLKLSKVNNQFVPKDFEPELGSTDQIEVSPSLNEGKENLISSTESIDSTLKANNIEHDLENSRPKRLSISGFGEYNNIDVPAKPDVFVAEQRKDNNEFIFMKEESRAVDDKQPSNNIVIEDDVEIATEIVWLEESTTRQKRSVNIIEEENLGTTVSGFKFTGREPRINSHLVYKNINV